MWYHMACGWCTVVSCGMLLVKCGVIRHVIDGMWCHVIGRKVCNVARDWWSVVSCAMWLVECGVM